MKAQFQLLQDSTFFKESENLLEADGLKLIDFSKVASNSDLRMSIDPSSSATGGHIENLLLDPNSENNQANQTTESMLENLTNERDQLRRKV